MRYLLFSIGNINVHGYGFMISLGIIFCILLGIYRAKKQMMNKDAVLDIALIGIIAGFGGAKLLYLIVEFEQFIKHPMQVLGSSGFVVYGGIIAGILFVMLYCRRKKLSFLAYFDLLAPSLALAQGFGRIGCFLAGCCYGKETTSILGVIFPATSQAPSVVKLLPTQLFSSIGDFAIVIILIVYEKFAKRTGNTGILYLYLYGIGRFLLEFLRSDERGFIGILSTSQLISILVVIIAVILTFQRLSRTSSRHSQIPENLYPENR